MTGTKRYLAILLIAFFSIATTATLVMAHCDHSAQGTATIGIEGIDGIEKKTAGCNHSHAIEEQEHNSHDHSDNDHSKTHKNSDTSTTNADQTSCLVCSAGLCHSQATASTSSTPTLLATTSDDFHAAKSINLKTGFLTIIPNPPNFIS